jgi:hypothetical protein
MCATCGYRHAIPRFAALQLESDPPCDRDPHTLGDVLGLVLGELRERGLLGDEGR